MTVKHKGLFKEDHPLRNQSIALNARQSMMKKSQIDHCEDIEQENSTYQAATESYRMGVDNRLQRSTNERLKAKAIDRVYMEGKNVLFKDFFSTLVVESLVFDEDALRERESAIRTVVESYVEEEGGFEFLTEAIKKHPEIPFLQTMKEVCESTAKQVSLRKRREMENNPDMDPNAIDFNLSDEEKKEYDYKKEETSLPEISELVKSKVLTVVKDEKQRAKEQKDLQEAIEAEVAAELESDEGGSVTTESFQAVLESRIIEKPLREESTLYDSIMRNTFMNAVKESAEHETKSTSHTDEYFETKNDFINSQMYGGAEDDLDLDLILAESLLQHTIMECAYTIGLTDYDRKDIQKISQALLN